MTSPAQQLSVIEVAGVDDGRKRYDATGMLAIDPQAFFMLFSPPSEDGRTNRTVGDVEVIDISGPLEDRAYRWCDSYEAILGRMDMACGGAARAIVLAIDTPGGSVAGCFDTARALRAKAVAAGKALYAHVTNKAHSAGYALAAAAQSISLTETALVGSIGVINTRTDYTLNNEQRGVRYAIVASGARKRDGHMDFPITEAELAATQSLVDASAKIFFDLVAELRGVSAEAVAQQQAGIFMGQQAVSVGLADHVQTFEQLLAMIAGSPGETPMAASAYQKAKDALAEAAKVDDANGRAAKKALAALGAGDEETPAEETPAETPAEETPAAASSATAASSASPALAATVQTLSKDIAALKAATENTERTAFLATRPDLAPELVTVLQARPLAEVKQIVNALPRAAAPNPAAAAAATGTRGEGQGDGNAARLPADQKFELDAMMGLGEMTAGVNDTGIKLELGVMKPAAKTPPAATPSATPAAPAK